MIQSLRWTHFDEPGNLELARAITNTEVKGLLTMKKTIGLVVQRTVLQLSDHNGYVGSRSGAGAT